MHTPRGFLIGPVVMLLSLTALADPAQGQASGPAAATTAPAVAPPATRPDRPTPPQQKAIDDAVRDLADRQSSPEAKIAACEALRRLGPAARDAAPALASMLWEDPPVRGAATEALRAIGPDAVPALLKEVDSRNKADARLPAVALIRAIPQSKDAVPKLVKDLEESRDTFQRELAIDGLAAIGPAGGQRSIDGLVKALGDPAPWVASAAARALPSVAPKLEGAVISRITALHSPNWTTQVSAAWLLGESNSQDPLTRRIAGTALAAAMKEPAPPVRAAAAAAIARLRPPGDTVVPVILEVLRHPTRIDGVRADERVVSDAVAVLIPYAAEAKAAAPELARLLYWDEPDVVKNATAALIAIGPDAAPPLITALVGTGRRDDDPLPRCRAAAVLPDLYPCGEPTIAALIKALQDQEESVRLAAAGALGSCAPRPASARPALAAALKDPSAHVRREALRAWTALGPAADAAGAGPAPDVPALLTVLKGNDNPARAEAASALASIGPPAAGEALPPLTRMADNRQVYLRRAAAHALAKLDPEGRGLVPALVAAVKNADAEAGAVLVAAVRRSPDRADAARRMDALSREEADPAVRDEAARAAKDLER